MFDTIRRLIHTALMNKRKHDERQLSVAERTSIKALIRQRKANETLKELDFESRVFGRSDNYFAV